jgi:hypothetical protein
MGNPPEKPIWITLRIKRDLYQKALRSYMDWHKENKGKSFSEWVRSLIRKETGRG